MIALWLVIGIVIGALASALVARPFLKRAVAGARAAEQRATGAERLAEIGAMTGGLAHEIKNPLSTIGLNAQLLAEGIEATETDPAERTRLTRRADALGREVERLRGILTDFLEFAGELRLDKRDTDINAAVEELADFFLPQADSNRVRLRTDLHAGDLRASVDVSHVKQAVLNLLLNATQAMAAGDASEEAPREVFLKTERALDHDRAPVVMIHVIDTGPGMDEQTRAKIFQPYFTTKSGGTGLGLPTARRIVEAHGGRLELHTEPGRGTDFTLVFPAT